MRKRQNRMLMLPRGYISYSALTLWKHDRDHYINHYFYGEPGIRSTKAMNFGQEFANAIETRNHRKRMPHADPIVEMVIQSIPNKPKHEHEMHAELSSKHGIIKLVGTLDAYDPKTHAFDEYKTGTRNWSPAKAKHSDQIKFYALMIWLNHGAVTYPKNLIWIRTERTPENEIRPTGAITSYPIVLTLPELLEFSRKVINVATEISEMYQQIIKTTI